MSWKPITLGPFSLESVQLRATREPTIAEGPEALEFLFDLEEHDLFYIGASGTSFSRGICQTFALSWEQPSPQVAPHFTDSAAEQRRSRRVRGCATDSECSVLN